jgi:hypothetical protein
MSVQCTAPDHFDPRTYPVGKPFPPVGNYQCSGCGQRYRFVIPFTIFPADRISDDRTVEDRIWNAVKVERERCAKIAESYYEWHKPDVPEYCEGDPAGDIAVRIRSAK